MKYIFRQLSLIIIFLLVMFSSVLTAQDNAPPELKDIIVTTSNTHLLLFATVTDSFTPEMITGVQNGIPISFVYEIELIKTRSSWFDTTLVDMTVTHTMTFDTLKEEYTIEHSNRKGKRSITRSLEEAKRLMSELNGIKVIPLEQLVPDSPYTLRLKATLEKNTLPLGIHYVLPFTSLWDFETDWRNIDFRY